MPATAARDLIVLLTHRWGAREAEALAALAGGRGAARDLLVVVHTDDPAVAAEAEAGAAPAPVLVLGTGDLLRPAYAAKLRAAGGEVLPGHVDLIDLAVFDRCPDYRFYWRIEYDVVFTGTWSALFDRFDRLSPADLLTTTIRPVETVPDWPFRDRFRWPADRPAPTRHLVAFLPIARLSAAALAALRDAYAAGVAGHMEMVWPTVIEAAGLAVEDLGGTGPFVAPANRDRFYRNAPDRAYLSPGTFVYRPAFVRLPDARPVLWHPVKAPDAAGTDGGTEAEAAAGRYPLARRIAGRWRRIRSALTVRAWLRRQPRTVDP
jgi:hypothetical protein